MINLSEFINEFLNIFPTLTNSQRKVFKYLHWFSRKFRCVFPCIQKIANAVGCCIRTVMRATAYFCELGWLYKKKRGYCSNLYYLNDEIISLNLDDESIFLRSECHLNVTVLRSSSSDNLDISTKQAAVHPQKGEKQRDIPYCLKISSLSESQRQSLADEFSEYQLVKAIAAAKKYTGWGNRIKCMGKYLWKAAKYGWS